MAVAIQITKQPKTLASLCGALFGLFGCGSESTLQLETGSRLMSGIIAPNVVIEDNELTPVDQNGSNVPSSFASVLDGIGMMRETGCTATHIGHGIAISAGHCFLDANTSRKDNFDCREVEIEWAVRSNGQANLVSNCLKVLAAENTRDRDYAIFLVHGAPAVSLALEEDELQLGERVTIFSHPQRRNLEWSGTCVVLDPSFAKFEEGRISHQCDTEEGSSGSSLLNEKTMKVVAIHSGGADGFNDATRISNTPVADFSELYLGKKKSEFAYDETEEYFGKHQLGNNAKNRTLTTLQRRDAASAGGLVSFELTVEFNDNEDEVILIDGNGDIHDGFKGKQSYKIESLAQPVEVRFNSNRNIRPSFVKVGHVSF